MLINYRLLLVGFINPAVEVEEEEWQRFRSAFSDESNRRKFDELFHRPTLYVLSCSYVVTPVRRYRTNNTAHVNPLP
jgi:hypothetical protein